MTRDSFFQGCLVSFVERGNGRTGLRRSLAALALSLGCCAAQAQTITPAVDTPAAPDEIVRKIVEQDEFRAEHLKHYSGPRHYHLAVREFGKLIEATMDVDASYDAASGKSFHVTGESGSKTLVNHVLHKLLETEKDDSHSRDTALSTANYRFEFEGSSQENGRQLYLFEVKPIAKSKLLYQGKIWVDAHDFALVRVEAQPAENPSFWIKSTTIDETYAKTGPFWFPTQNKSESKVRFGGTAVLTIDYGTYQLNDDVDRASAEAGLAGVGGAAVDEGAVEEEDVAGL